jgi:hypothetical protein
MAFQALIENDLRSMISSWGVRIWLVLAIFQAIITLPAAISEGPAAQALADVLGSYPIIWSTFAIVLSAGAVSSEAGVVADSILSKAVTRYEYILAKLFSRILVVLGVYLLVALPSAYLTNRFGGGSLTTGGIGWGIVLIGVTMILITSVAVSFSTLFSWTLVAVMGAWFLWYVTGGIFALLEIEQLSPLHIVESLPDVLQGDYADVNRWRILLMFGAASALISGLSILHFARKDL